MKDKLTIPELEALLPKIQRVLDTGKPWEDKTLHHPAGAITTAMLGIKGMARCDSDAESNEGFTANGWQYDWWQEFTYNGKRYTLSGSGYYGGHAFNVSDHEA